MSKAFTSAGTLISISDGIPLLYNRENLRELSWYEIGEIPNAGEKNVEEDELDDGDNLILINKT